MEALFSELVSLEELYAHLKNVLTVAKNSVDSQDLPALTEATLRHRELFAQVGQMSAKAARIAHNWSNCEGSMEPAVKEQILSLAAKVQEEGNQLFILCSDLLQQLQECRGASEKRLEAIRKGRNYLHSVRPVKTNYPKFLDSLG